MKILILLAIVVILASCNSSTPPTIDPLRSLSRLQMETWNYDEGVRERQEQEIDELRACLLKSTARDIRACARTPSPELQRRRDTERASLWRLRTQLEEIWSIR